MTKKLTYLIWLGILIGLTASQPHRTVEIRILSFSINHGKDFWAESNLRQVLKVITKYKPQLVALQEVDSLVSTDKINFHLRQLSVQTGYDYLYGASGKVENGTYGVGLLSQWPFEKTQKITLPSTAGMDERVMACGLVSPTKGLYLRACSARLEYGSIFDRTMQAAFVDKVLSPSIQPVILALDMGISASEPPYKSFQSDWLDAAEGSEKPTWSSGATSDRIDFLLVLKNSKVRVKAYEVIGDIPTASDHLPILATFEVW